MDPRWREMRQPRWREICDPIGIKIAQSILRSATQGSLSHFHTAGMMAGSSSVHKPSVADTMDSKYTANNTSMKFNILGTDNHPASIVKHLVGKELLWFITMIRSNITGLPSAENIWYDVLKEHMYDGVIIRFYIDYQKLVDHGLTLHEIASTCFEDFTWHVSPDFMGMIDVDVPDYISKVLSQMGTLVCGTPDILYCHINQITKTAVTRGSNILAVSRTRGIDKGTIVSNHITDVEKNLGVEAAARALSNMIGSSVISDFMTRTGRVLPFLKHSIEVQRKGILTSTGFERPKNDIKTAVQHSAWDKHVSVYADIMTGKDPLADFELY